jgi:hypothetical protein
MKQERNEMGNKRKITVIEKRKREQRKENERNKEERKSKNVRKECKEATNITFCPMVGQLISQLRSCLFDQQVGQSVGKFVVGGGGRSP